MAFAPPIKLINKISLQQQQQTNTPELFLKATTSSSSSSHEHAARSPKSSTSSSSSQQQRNIIVLCHNVSQDVVDGFFDVNTLLTHRIDVLARCINSALWVSNGIRKNTNIFLMLFPHNLTIEVRGCDVHDLNPDERTTALCLQQTLLLVAAAGNNTANNKCSSSSSSHNTTTTNMGNVNNDHHPSEENKSRRRRRQQINRLEEKVPYKRPETINPHKPGSMTKSEKRALRITRKAREAMVRRIHRSDNNHTHAPKGFFVHRDDTLQERLQNLPNGQPALTLTTNDTLGEPLLDLLLTLEPPETNNSNDNNNNSNKDDNVDLVTTTIILGDQIGYAACDEKMLTESDAVRPVSLGPLLLLTSQCITIAHFCLDLHGL